MVNLIKVLINIFHRKEVYGTIITIAIAYFVYQSIKIILDSNIDKGKDPYERKKRKTLTKFIENVIKIFFEISTVVVLLTLYGVNVKGMLAGLGIVATIVGLALQDTLKDIISGINIMLEDYFVVGDIVTYGTFAGSVVEFGLRTTKIKDASGQILTVANRNIMEIKNISKKEQTTYIRICLPYEENVSKLEKIINKQILPKVKEVENVIPTSVDYLGIDEMADSCVKYLIQFSCKRETQWKAKRDINKIILTTLNQNNINIPYQQLEVHNGK